MCRLLSKAGVTLVKAFVYYRPVLTLRLSMIACVSFSNSIMIKKVKH